MPKIKPVATKKITQRERYSMDFEFAMRRFIGDKGYGLAGIYHNDKNVKKGLRRLIPTIKKRIDEMDTSNRHKEMLFANLLKVEENLKSDSAEDYKGLSIALFKLCSLLFGYTSLGGKPTYNVVCWQNRNSYLWEHEDHRNGKNIHDVFQDNQKNVITLRKEVFDYLKSKNIDDNTVAQVLNTSEYQIKGLKKDYEK
jgi:hypothetical protein